MQLKVYADVTCCPRIPLMPGAWMIYSLCTTVHVFLRLPFGLSPQDYSLQRELGHVCRQESGPKQ